MALSPIRVLGLAVGGAGLELGIKGALGRIGRTSRLVCAVEIEAYAAATLAARMAEGALDDAPIWSDVRTFDARAWRGVVDLVAAGYPCQPFSLSGKRLGADDPRHIWPHIARIVAECEPGLCVFENVVGHVSSGAREVIGELQAMGYHVAATLWTAEEVGAPHRRERFFIVAAHPDRWALRDVEQRSSPGRHDVQAQGQAKPRDDVEARPVADADGEGQLQPEGRVGGERGRARDGRRGWPAEPRVGRVAHGLAFRMDRLRLLGNGCVPQQAEGAILECLEALGVNVSD